MRGFLPVMQDCAKVGVESVTMIKTYLFTQTETREDVSLENWQSLVEGDSKLLWVDVRSVTQEDMDLLSTAFRLHALAVESVLDGYRRPHLIQFPDHFYVNMTMIKSTRDDHGVKPVELHLFAGGKFMITAVKDAQSGAVDNALEEFMNAPNLCARGPMYAVYLLAEDLVETYYPVVDKLDDDADKLENVMLDRGDRVALKHNLALKHRGFELRKLLGPQRDILNDLSRRDFPFIEGENQVYFQDVYNRMIRLFDILDSVREVLSGNLDIYLSTVSNRLNEVMKVLTVFATILMTLSLITGFYGMNFIHIPWLASPNAFRNVLIGMGAITAGMLLWFHRKGWV